MKNVVTGVPICVTTFWPCVGVTECGVMNQNSAERARLYAETVQCDPGRATKGFRVKSKCPAPLICPKPSVRSSPEGCSLCNDEGFHRGRSGFPAVGRCAQRLTVLAPATIMSSSELPPEILYLIVDHLSDEPTTLNACCVVSKSWVPCARRHLFFQVQFSWESQIKSWMKVFPDPSSSPAYYVRVLMLRSPEVVIIAGTYARACISSFCHVAKLQVNGARRDATVSLVPFHRLSPTLRSLSLHLYSFPPQEVLKLICSFPLLENLSLSLSLRLRTDETVTNGWDAPSNSMRLTGSLYLGGQIRPVARMLLHLPNGLRFSKITMMCKAGDAGAASDLMSKCSDTLESLCIGYYIGPFHSPSVVGRCLTATRRVIPSTTSV